MGEKGLPELDGSLNIVKKTGFITFKCPNDIYSSEDCQKVLKILFQ